MIKQLKVLADLSSVKDRLDIKSQTESSEQELRDQLADANNRLREVNRLTRDLISTLLDKLDPVSDAIAISEALTLRLEGLSVPDQKAYMSTFTPEVLNSIDKSSAKSAKAIRKVLRENCKKLGMPLLYKVWEN